MHYSTHSKNSTANLVNYQTDLSQNSLPKSEVVIDQLPPLSPETKKEDRKAFATQKETTTASTDSTDSGVNLSDSDDLPTHTAESTQLQSFEAGPTPSHGYKRLHKHNKGINRFNNVSSNQNNNCNNRNKSHVISYDDESENIYSQNIDKKFKVTDRDNGNSTRYQQKPPNFIHCKNAVNIGELRNREILTPTNTSTPRAIAPTSEQHKDKQSFQQNEFIHLQGRSFSPASSFSSTANSYFSSNMQHCKGSPAVSIRSISSAIVTSESDSDSDLNSDGESYVIQKLGTQVTYSPNDPEIPNINRGHAVLNHKVITGSNQISPHPLESLAVIGDRIGAAQALGAVPSISGIVQRPQIGSVALSNSSDVTFGDKHFYEGPVTIQQFLIDSRDKWKEANGTENPAFTSENLETVTNNVKDPYPEEERSNTVYEYILKRRRKIIPAVLAFTILLIVATVWGSKLMTESKNTNSSENTDDCGGNGTLCLIDGDLWGAHPQTGPLDKQKLPLHRVVISHTASEPCDSIQTCADRVRVIQEFHMNSFGWDDIGYNFLISSDGRVYVGRGWDYVGAHTKGYNYDSVGIAFIGTYNAIEPSHVQLNACLALLEEGINLKKLVPNYRLYGARQLGSTESPGEMLYKIIKKWKHWSSNTNLT